MDVSIEAEIGIRRLHALCADAVWRRDGETFAACHVEDATWKIVGRELRGRRAIARALDDFGAANERVLMVFGSPILTNADTAVLGRTYTVEHVKHLDGSTSSTIGIYYERFVLSDDRWLFGSRHFDFAYYGPANLSASFYPMPDYGPPPGRPLSSTPSNGPIFD